MATYSLPMPLFLWQQKATNIAVKNHTRSDSVFRRKEELESFFLSEWFRLPSGLDGRYFMKKMQEVYYFDR